MKAAQFLIAAFFVVVPNVAFSAPVQDETVQNNGLLRDLKAMTQHCVVEPYVINDRGEKIMGPLKSVCAELQPSARGGVAILIHGRRLHAFIIDSENSDGGDLDHLIVLDTKGDIVAERRNILAFDDIFIALAGGDQDFRQVQE